MSFQHKELAAGRWRELSFVEQMAHVGSEVDRAIHWKRRGHAAYFEKAADRALELLDLTLDIPAGFHRLKEIARVREFLVDFFFGTNEIGSTDEAWERYFLSFACAARQGR